MYIDDVGKHFWESLTDETRWCLHYAVMHGVHRHNIKYVIDRALMEPEKRYTLVENTDTGRFITLAKKLRILWPKGMRIIDNKEYAWRDTPKNIAKRLETLFRLRDLYKFTDDDVLSAARRYVSRFDDDKNKKYMKNVSYFILKKDHKDMDRLKSVLADMLENVYDNEDDMIGNIETFDNGEII